MGDWVRAQSGSASETVLALARDAWQRRQAIGVRDPGPGEDRLKIRLEPRVLQFIRAASHSREATAAVRKLLRWGFEGKALPASPSYSRPLVSASIQSAEPIITSPSVSLLAIVSDPEATRLLAARYKANPELAQRARALKLARAASPQQVSIVTSRRLDDAPAISLPAPLERLIQAMPVPVLAIGSIALVAVGGYFALKALGALLATAGMAAGSAAGATVTAATAAPTIAAWTPQAAAGLGALLL
jgi:hypothetical protein